MDRGRTRYGLRPPFHPGAAEQAEAGHLDPDAGGHADPDPADQGHFGQGDFRRGQFGLAQVQPGAADQADHDFVLGHPPRPGHAQTTDRRDMPGGRRGRRPASHGRRGCLGGQVSDEVVQFGPGPGRRGAVHPLAELLQGQPTVPGGHAQPLDGGVPLRVRRPDIPGRLAAFCAVGHFMQAPV
jgi:hypothetical protein